MELGFCHTRELTSISSASIPGVDFHQTRHRSLETHVHCECEDETAAEAGCPDWNRYLVSNVNSRPAHKSSITDFNPLYRFDNMAPAFIHCPTYFASNNYQEPTSQETGPYAELFNCGFWDRVNSTPKLKHEFDTYMAAHKKGGSSLVDLLPYSRLVEGYNPASPVLLVDIGGNIGHQCIELKTRYPTIQGEIIVQDLQCAEDLGVAGVRGMAYNFFTPQPIKGEMNPPGPRRLSTLTHQVLDSITTAPFSTTGRTPSASRSCKSWLKRCGLATPDC